MQESKEQQPEYPDSPFRLKKKTLNQLKLKEIKQEEQEQEATNGPADGASQSNQTAAGSKFDSFELEGRFQVVMYQLERRKQQYEAVKDLSVD